MLMLLLMLSYLPFSSQNSVYQCVNSFSFPLAKFAQNAFKFKARLFNQANGSRIERPGFCADARGRWIGELIIQPQFEGFRSKPDIQIIVILDTDADIGGEFIVFFIVSVEGSNGEIVISCDDGAASVFGQFGLASLDKFLLQFIRIAPILPRGIINQMLAMGLPEDDSLKVFKESVTQNDAVAANRENGHSDMNGVGGNSFRRHWRFKNQESRVKNDGDADANADETLAILATGPSSGGRREASCVPFTRTCPWRMRGAGEMWVHYDDRVAGAVVNEAHFHYPLILSRRSSTTQSLPVKVSRLRLERTLSISFRTVS